MSAAIEGEDVLRPELGCCGWLHWECSLPPGLPPEPLDQAMVDRGRRSVCHHPAIRLWRDVGGNEIVWVPATGRVQIRVHRLVPEAERRDLARRLHGDLLSAVKASAGIRTSIEGRAEPSAAPA